MLKTRLTKEYKLDVPFVNAGMAFVATAPLAAAVCKAGGLGMIGIAAMEPAFLRAQINEIRRVTSQAFGVDIIARFSTPEQIDVLVEEKVPLVVFFWDEAPATWIARLHAAGSKIWIQVGSITEARAAIAQGVDQDYAARNRFSSANVSSGTSSVSQWPDGNALPDTWVARSRQTARTSYFRPTMPLAPQSTSTGHAIFLFMSASSCARSIVEAAR